MPVPYWRLSGFYFFYFATLGAFVPYWNLYLQKEGFNPVEIGNLSAVMVATRIVAPTFWGWVSDRSGKKLKVIRLTLFFGALVFAFFVLAKGYWFMAAVTFGFGFFWNAALPQFEAATLSYLKNEPYRYSRIRLWGSVGFIALVLGLGWVFDRWPLSALPVIIAAILAVNWLVTLTMPLLRSPKSMFEPNGVIGILKRRNVQAFLLVSMLLQVAHGPYYVFYSIYLKQLGYSATLTGFLWALGVLSEIVLFIFMRPLLARFSLPGILSASMLLAACRWLLIAWCAEIPSLLALAQLLHAASFGSAHIASIHLVHRYFGETHQSKGQAAYSSFSFGLGGMLGSVYSGYYWELWGPKLVYSLAALFCYLAFLISHYGVRQENTTKPLH